MKGLALLALVAVLALLMASFLGSRSGGNGSGGAGDLGGGINDAFDNLMQAIFQFEGGKPGDRNSRNNNPGNLKTGSLAPGTVAPIGTDSQGFAIFADIGDGWDALSNYLSFHLYQHPDWNFNQLFSFYLNGKPDSGKTAEGDPAAYANYVADYIGVDPTTNVNDVTAAQ